MTLVKHFGSFLMIAALTVACGKSGGSAAPSANPAPTAPAEAPAGDPAAVAKNIFETRCTPCHGPQGRGDGTASAALNPKPRNFHDKTWQGSVTDEHIQTIIQTGGAAVGKSPAMPNNPDLVDKPEVVSALKDIVRTFGTQE